VAAAPFQTSQASTGAPRHQPASTSSTAAGPPHPAKLRAQTAAQASAPGPPPPPPQAPSLAAGQSAPPQRLVLTSQAQARLPSKWPCRPASALAALKQRVRNTGYLKSLCCPLLLSILQPRPSPAWNLTPARGRGLSRGHRPGPCSSLLFLLTPCQLCFHPAPLCCTGVWG
jgi:hypothetical protein